MSKNQKKSTKKINIEPINKNKALIEAKIKYMINNGRVEITSINDLKKYPIGSMVSYMTKKGIYKSGGFLLKINDHIDDNYFIYVNFDKDQKIRVRMERVDKIWIGDVYKTSNDVVSLVATKKKETSKPVIIGDIVIYYANSIYDYNRYVCTNKYKLTQKWYEMFGQ